MTKDARKNYGILKSISFLHFFSDTKSKFLICPRVLYVYFLFYPTGVS